MVRDSFSMDPTMSAEDIKDFEKGRIKALQEERLHIQKKTFTKWMNSFLQKAKMQVDDLFTDLGDGRKLLKLLEIISGEKLGKPNSGKMRVHRIENVNKSLAFLHTKVRLENIGAEDVVDGNPRMILGLIWTIILRFQIQEIEINLDEEDEREGSVKKSAKEALLLWCQRKTNGYQHVQIDNFTSSWQTGMGFNALIHHHRPDLINFQQLRPDDHLENLRNAFDVAEKHLGIPKLLDAEDVDVSRPDEKSVLTYVASYYHTFSKMKAGATGGKRIGNIISKIKAIEQQKSNFESYSTQLLLWINMKIVEIKQRNLPNSLEEIQASLKQFKDYRMVEKPPKYQEKVEIEATYFDIQIKLQQLRQAAYLAPEGQRPHDIEQAWQVLEKEEHLREVALKDELLRQERLAQLAYKFERKSVLREGYLNEMIQVLSDPRYGSNLTQVMASVKKHEAISADILARRDRFLDLRSMSQQLENENYHLKVEIVRREKEIMARWDDLLALLANHKEKLERSSYIINLQREIDTNIITVKNLQDEMGSESGAPIHLLDVQEKLQKFHLQESQVNAISETIKRMKKEVKSVEAMAKGISSSDKEGAEAINAALIQPVHEKHTQLEQLFNNLLDLCRTRQGYLEDFQMFYQLVQDLEEEGQWVDEKLTICSATIQAKDLRALTSLQQKHNSLCDEMVWRQNRFKSGALASAEEIIAGNHPKADYLKDQCTKIQQKWLALIAEAEKRKLQLESGTEAYQFFSDCNETDSVVKECITIAQSKDFGQDKLTAISLLQRHKQLVYKIQSLAVDLQRVQETGDKLKEGDRISQEALYLMAEPNKQQDNQKLVAVEVWEDEPYERTEIQKVIEDKKVPQVKMLYPYTGHGMTVTKGEIMFLLDKTNADWWNVRKVNGQNGFVPANYVKEVQPTVVSVEVKKPVVVKDVRKVKRTQYVKQETALDSQKSGKEVINDRQKAIQENYTNLQKLSEERQLILQNSLQLFDYYDECADFGKWLREKQKTVASTADTDVQTSTKNFEKFLTDFSANKHRLANIDSASAELLIKFPELKKEILTKQRETHRLYDALLKLKEEEEKNLEGSASVIFFMKSGDDVCDWIAEKSAKLDMDDLAKDLTTVKALQRKHKGIERELAPIKDKVGQVTKLGQDVLGSFPEERTNIEKRILDVQAQWEMLEQSVMERSRRLEDAVGMQLFNNGVREVLEWANSTLDNMDSHDPVRDVQTAEAALARHNEIGDEIRTRQDEFGQLASLGETMYARAPSQDIQDKMTALAAHKESVLTAWQVKSDSLKQDKDLQQFNREADHIDSATGAHLKVLERMNSNSATTDNDVDVHIKRFEDFAATVHAQEERVKVFVESADQLQRAGHPQAPAIQDKREKVVVARDKLKKEMATVRAHLEESKLFEEFKMQLLEMQDFIKDKQDMATKEESGANKDDLKAKAKKHEVLEGEIKANSGQLKVLNRTGQQMIARSHYNADNIASDLEGLNSAWESLVGTVKSEDSRLGQAKAQAEYNQMTADVKHKLEDIQSMVSSQDVGKDMRYCKALVSQHNAAEQELDTVDAKIVGLTQVAPELADGHFDSANILSTCKGLEAAVAALKPAAAERRAALNRSMKYHEFRFDLARELEWIGEKTTILTTPPDIKGLQAAQRTVKKHKKLEEEISNHSVVIQKVVASGQTLLDDNPQDGNTVAEDIVANTGELEQAWQQLAQLSKQKEEEYLVALKAQQYYFEVAEIESWIGEKSQGLKSQEYGKDESSSIKLLTRHKGVELEIDTYSGIIQELSNSSSQLISSGHPDSKVIKARDDMLNRELRSLKNIAKERRDRLVQTIQLHEYLRETEEVKEYISQQRNNANFQDIGRDYEHFEILLARFQEFKLKLQAGEEKFRGCEGLARRLDTLDPNLSNNFDVKDVQSDLTNRWLELIQAIEKRDQALESAGEIHRFNRDIAEALSRIGEKEAILQTDDKGRDTKSAQALIRKHESYENDLVALEAQLQVINDDAVALQDTYPDSSAHVSTQLKGVMTAWSALKEKSTVRKGDLVSSNDYFTFLSITRDLLAWSAGLRRSLTTEEKVSDAASAQVLKAEHEDLKAEIETREKLFSEVVALGEAMTSEDHPASQEVKSKTGSVLAERQKLHTAWQHKKIYLDQLIDIHFFLRDAKQILATLTAQEVALTNTDTGTTIVQAEAALKAHEAFMNLVASQEEKYLSLKEHADKLIRQEHFDSPTIKTKLGEISAKRATVGELCNKRTDLLNLNHLYAKFVQETSEELSWIEEKQRILDSSRKQVEDENTDLTEKIRLLQKHQALQAEIDRHKPQITEVCSAGNQLVQQGHEARAEVNSNLNSLVKAWEALQSRSNAISKGLDEARGILEFQNEVDKIETWIRDKELMVSQGDLGKDYEHCLELQKKLDDVNSDMRVDESRIVKILAMADNLASEDATEAGTVAAKQADIKDKWKALQVGTKTYRERLNIAGAIHSFQRDTDETLGRTKEKLKLMDSTDMGKDLNDVQELIKKVETVVEYMAGIEKRIADHKAVSSKLINDYPDMTSEVKEKMAALTAAWDDTNKKVVDRESALVNSVQFHQFVHACQEYQTWLLDMDKKLKAVEVPTSASEADVLLSLHKERRTELNSRQEQFKSLKTNGDSLIAEGHAEADKIGAEIEKTTEIQENVAHSWEQAKLLLIQGNQLHAFRQQQQLALSWLEQKEAVLNNDDIGDSLAAVEALKRKHEGFVNTFEKQSIVMADLLKRGEELINNDHNEGDKIKEYLEAAQSRLAEARDKCQARHQMLVASTQLQQFLRKTFDLKAWIKERTKVALDESYLDLSNLVNKIQKHTSFEAEVGANKARLTSVQEEGEAMCQANHFASQEIVSQLEDLQSEWSHLVETSGIKRTRLAEANSALVYFHSVDEFEGWLESVESSLESEDHGKDLTAASKLLKKLISIEQDVGKKKEAIKSLEDQCAKFNASKHFMASEMEARYGSLQARFEALHEPLQIRRDNLEDSQQLHSFNREVADESFWIEEKLPLASSDQLGHNSQEVQALQQRHDLLVADIQSHEKSVTSLEGKAEQMLRGNHFAAESIKSTVANLKANYGQLKDLAGLRRLKLVDAAEAQLFYQRLNEVVDWIKEKDPILKIKDVPNDRDSVQVYLKKMTDILSEMETGGVDKKVDGLKVTSDTMVERKHFDAENIRTKITDLTELHENFKSLLIEQRQSLLDQMTVIEFINEAEDVTEWIDAQMMIAASEDYGKDVGHVEILIKSFNTFFLAIEEYQEKYKSVVAMGQELVEAGNVHHEMASMKLVELEQLWEDLRELSLARQEALSGAKQVHVFDKNADETIMWIGEKEALFLSEDLGQDLETIQSLLDRQDGFKRDLDAIEGQVKEVESEATVLCELFPDASAHVESKVETTRSALVNLTSLATTWEHKLKQNQIIQRYFDDYRELMAWSSEVLAKMTSPDLAEDLAGAETLITRHNEIKAEMDSRADSFAKFQANGESLISGGHFMSSEIGDKISALKTRKEKMYESWELRMELYNQHLDYLVWVKDVTTLESWISSREPTVRDATLGETIDEVENLLKHQRDFEGTVVAQENKLEGVNRITLIEKNFTALREKEDAEREEESRRKEQERLEGIKKKELTRINNERRRENERRRTQEIRFNKEDFDQMRKMGNPESSSNTEDTSPFSKQESIRLDPKKQLHKRIPSFTTRRPTQSFRRHTKNLRGMENLPPVEIDGYLERKQELQAGGKRATIRSWKSYYSVLCGQLLCFFRDQEDFLQSKAASSPIMIHQAGIEAADDYTKKSFVFRIHSTDGSEYLFATENQESQQEWVKKLKFHAGLPPSQQLRSYNSLVENGNADDISERSERISTSSVHSATASLLSSSPPLPSSQPPPPTAPRHSSSSTLPAQGGASRGYNNGMREGYGVQGTKELLSKKAGSREGIAVPDSGVLVDPVLHRERLVDDLHTTLPASIARRSHSSQDGSDTTDTVSVTSATKEKKGSVLRRFLGGKKT